MSPLYFDLPAYVDSEIKRQSGEAVAGMVVWEKDGVVEKKSTPSINWTKAFSALAKLDMNRSAYRGRYKVDTVFVGDQFEIHYRAQSGGINPQSVTLVYGGSALKSLQLNVLDKNFLYSSEVDYSYVPDSTFRISGTQQIIFGKKHSYKRSYSY